ncbi:MAG: hypothetical protein KTR25_15395 [Myxococcales bacterium]|nr:hypothetical protein [Myxococcales bacterium]
MRIVQLAAEGLRHFPDRTYFGFQGQLDLVRLASGSQRQAFFDLLFCALLPNPDRTDLCRSLVNSSSSRSRTIITLADRDQNHYRVLRELRTGECRLLHLPSPEAQPAVISSNTDEIRRFLRVKLELPYDADYEALFVFSHDALPSRGGYRRVRSGVRRMPLVPSGPGLSRPMDGHRSRLNGTGGRTNAAVVSTALSHDEAASYEVVSGVSELSDQSLLNWHHELRQERRRARRFARARRTLAALDEKTREARASHIEMVKLQERLKQTEAGLQAQPLMAALPVGFRERWLRHLAVESEYKGKRASIERDLMRVYAVVDTTTERIRSWYFPMVVVGIIATILWWSLILWLQTPWLAFIQFLMGAAVGGLMYQDLKEREGKIQKLAKTTDMEDHLVRLERQYVLDTAAVRGLLDRLGINDTSQLADQLQAYEEMVVERERLASQLDGQIGHHGRRAEAVLRRIAVRRAECEAVLDEETSTASLDSIEHRLKPLEQEIFSRRLTPLEEDNDPDNLPIIKDITDIPSLVRPASVLGGAIPNFDDDDDDDSEGGNDQTISGLDTAGVDNIDGYVMTSASLSGGLWCSADEYDSSSAEGATYTEYPSGGSLGTAAEASRPHALIQRAAALLGQNVETVAGSTTEARVGYYIQRLTDGQLDQVSLRDNQMVLNGKRGKTNYADLDGELLDQVDTGLRLALLEQILAVRSVPVVMEDSMLKVSKPQREALLETYEHLSSLTQVMVVTPYTDIAGELVRIESA